MWKALGVSKCEIVRRSWRVLGGSWRVLGGLGRSSQKFRALMVSMSLGVTLRVEKGLRGLGWVCEGPRGSDRVWEGPGVPGWVL